MQDSRLAFRLIRQNWAFSLMVIGILALSIGANTAVLSVVNAALVLARLSGAGPAGAGGHHFSRPV